MAEQIPASSYSTIFHCTESAFICILRLGEGIVSVGMFYLFAVGYKQIVNQRNNKLTKQDRQLYLLAMFQTCLLGLYYLVFEQFFMLASIRNLLIWVGTNVLQIFCLLNWDDQKSIKLTGYGSKILHVINFLLWFFISLGDGSSLVNTDFNLGYNCMIIDWMVMSGILVTIYCFVALLGFFKIQRLTFELQQLENQPNNQDLRKINSIAQQKLNITLLASSGLIGAAIMFGWDFLAFNKSSDRLSCEHLFSGDTIFRNLLCFILKIISMQMNPCTIYYIMYYSRKEQFIESNDPSKALMGDYDINYFDDGASDLNRTVSSRRSQSRANLVSGRQNVSQYH